MKWPLNISPYHIAILPIVNKNDKSKIEIAVNLFKKFKQNGIDIIIDDTDESISSKIKKFNLIGIPYQIIIGNNFDENKIEFNKIGENSEYTSLEKIIEKLNKEIKN